MKNKQAPGEYIGWQERVSALTTPEAVFKAYAQEWESRRMPPITWDILRRMVCGFTPAGEQYFRYGVPQPIADLVRRNEAAKVTIGRFRDELHQTFCADDHNDPKNALIVLLALIELSAAANTLRHWLHSIAVEDRLRRIKDWVTESTRVCGRAQTRNHIESFWNLCNPIEEECEALVEAALDNGVYDWQTLSALSPQARTIALRLLARGTVKPSDLGPFLSGEPVSLPSFGRRPNPVVQKVSALAQQAVIPTRLAGAGLNPEELDRVGLAWLHPILSALAFNRHRRLFHHPIIEELFHMWGRDWPSMLHLNYQGPTATNGFRMLGIPLVRLLHMRLVLEAPSLSSALASPESTLVPEVLLFLLGQEGVTYSPEITLPAGASSGWRRRWAETTGEALSSLFLEDALQLDLTTLFRLPESHDEKTPDFGAKTFAGEQIVFESKGATSWDSFCKSKRKALRQLAKDGPATSWQQSLGWGQNASGRAFACCLFCTNGGKTESSQFHVEDPPFAFAGLFHEGWESGARRRHYGAVLQAAGLFTQATALLDGQNFEVADNLTQGHSLELPDGEITKFAGRARDLGDLAGSLGHPQPGLFGKVSVFTGIEKELLLALSHQELPAGSPFAAEATDSIAPSKIPPFGILPGQSPDAPASGVFSRLSNGSYLAVSVREG